MGTIITKPGGSSGPTTLTFGGNLSFTGGSEVYAYNSVTALTPVYSTPTPVFATVGRNFWIDLSIETGNYAVGSNFSVKIYASSNGSFLAQLLGTYTVAVAANNTMYKMQRTFFTGSQTDAESGDVTYVLYGADPAVSSNSDGLTTVYATTSLGTLSVQYPYIVIAVQAGATNVYRLGPSRITYG